MQAAEARLGLLQHRVQLRRIANVGRGHEHLCPERFETPREVLLVGRERGTTHQDQARLILAREVLGEDAPDAAQPAGDEVHAVFAEWRVALPTARLETLDEARAVAVGDHRLRGIGLDLGGQARRACRVDIHHAAANRRELLRDNPRQGRERRLLRAFDMAIYGLNTQGDNRQARFRCRWPKRLRDLQ